MTTFITEKHILRYRGVCFFCFCGKAAIEPDESAQPLGGGRMLHPFFIYFILSAVCYIYIKLAHWAIRGIERDDKRPHKENDV